MKNLLLAIPLFFLAFALTGNAQVMIDDFDASDVNRYQLSIEGPPSRMDLTTNTSDKMQGTGALDVNAVIGSFHQWGSFAQLVYRTDSTDVLDWSIIGDSLSIWIKVRTAPTHPEYMVFRIHIADRPTPESDLEEYIYENGTVIDAQHNWYHLKIPLYERPQPGTDIPDSTGFILAPTSWGGFTYNNRTLDRDKIVGYNIGIITSGWDPNANLPADSLLVSFDAFERFGVRAVPFIFFNGKTLSSFLSQFTWGQSSLEVEEGTGATPGTNSLKWTQGNEWGNGWTGAGWNINTPLNMAGAWGVGDSLKFKMKAPAGTGPIRWQFEDGSAKVGYVFQPVADGSWHQYALALRDFVPQEGTSGFDSSNVTVFQVMAEASGEAGRIVYIDDLWTGNPIIDVVSPEAPQNVQVTTAGQYTNLVSWTDTPGESGETYRVYYATHPISNISAPDVELVKTITSNDIAEGIEYVEHVLYAPASDQNVTYYYALTCTDDFGNISDISQNTPPLTNLAKGVTVINPNAPINFAADGNLSEWSSITPFRMFVSDGSGHVVTNTTVTNDADLSVLAYVATDENYLYVAFDVVDDVVSTDTTFASYLIDSPDLYIGLYNWHGPTHTGYKRGAEPDYHFRFGRNALLVDNLGAHRILEQGNTNYYWDERFSPGYVVEAKIAFADIAAISGDDLFTPLLGMRIPIDFSVNDNDTPNSDQREGILTYSINNEDLSYQNVARWVYTWIGDQWFVGVEDEDNNTIVNYELFQNYPNPFNPSTQIRYTLEKSGLVTIKVYDVLGKEVAQIVNQEQNAGIHSVQFDASNLSSGVYFYRIESGSYVKVNKMMLLK